jgi:hypothetical protein
LPEIGPAEVPGTSYEYSNPGYNALAAAIEVASGKTIDCPYRKLYLGKIGKGREPRRAKHSALGFMIASLGEV